MVILMYLTGKFMPLRTRSGIPNRATNGFFFFSFLFFSFFFFFLLLLLCANPCPCPIPPLPASPPPPAGPFQVMILESVKRLCSLVLEEWLHTNIVRLDKQLKLHNNLVVTVVRCRTLSDSQFLRIWRQFLRLPTVTRIQGKYIHGGVM